MMDIFVYHSNVDTPPVLSSTQSTQNVRRKKRKDCRTQGRIPLRVISLCVFCVEPSQLLIGNQIFHPIKLLSKIIFKIIQVVIFLVHL